MSVYPLLQGISATGVAPTSTRQPVLVAVPPPPTPGTGSPVANQGFQVVVQAPALISVGGVVTVVASNDYVAGTTFTGNWAPIATVTVAAGTSPQSAIASTAVAYSAFGAYCPTLTGSGATLTCTMSA